MISKPAYQASSVATGVIIAFTVIPAICLTIGLIALKWFPLGGEEWKAQKLKLHEIHQKKETCKQIRLNL